MTKPSVPAPVVGSWLGLVVGALRVNDDRAGVDGAAVLGAGVAGAAGSAAAESTHA